MTKKFIAIITLILFYKTHTISRLKISFDKGMIPARKYNIYNAQTILNDDWKLVKNVYEKNFLTNLTKNKQPSIPKIIHQIWLGSSLPERYKILQQTWKIKHPNWEYKLWTDKDIEDFGLYNKKLYDQATNYGEKADIARYEILYRIGGLYVDTDFECLRPFDILNHSLDFYAGIVFKGLRINNALIASKPGHPIMKNCVIEMKEKPKNLEDRNATIEYTGPIFFTKIILDYLKSNNDERVVIFPNTFFYPITHFQSDINDIIKAKPWIKKETFAIHYWDFSWVKKQIFVN